MCGIVGYLGDQESQDVLYDGLKKLEYRGYDSSGVAVMSGADVSRVRASGKLENLKEKMKGQSLPGGLGIAHTRWATHGAPTENNAHPHTVGSVSIVHNGIIENYIDLKNEIAAKKGTLVSETDSEIIAWLLNEQIEKGLDLKSASLAVLNQLEGAYAVLCFSSKYPGEMIAIKNGPPLIIGKAGESFVVASDVQVIIPHTRAVVYLNDNECAHIKKDNVEFFTHANKKLNPNWVEVSADISESKKGPYKYFMLKEIYEQPMAFAKAIEPFINLETHQVNIESISDSFNSEDEALVALEKVEKINIIGCGTSYYSGVVAKYAIESLAKVPVEVDVASEFRYRDLPLRKNDLFFSISQSGETADTLAALRKAKENNLIACSLSNVANSSIDRESDWHLSMNAGAEIAVASTKAFVCSMAVLNIFAIALAKAKKQITTEQEQQLVRDMLAVSSTMEKLLSYDDIIEKKAEQLCLYKGYLFIGRGAHYPLALEGALKLKELAYRHAEGYAAGEMKHGPLALVDKEMLVVAIAPQDDLYDKTISNLEEAKARGAQVLTITSEGNTELTKDSVLNISMPKKSKYIMPILEAIPIQLLAYHISDKLGHDVDQPRNLAKSVTVE